MNSHLSLNTNHHQLNNHYHSNSNSNSTNINVPPPKAGNANQPLAPKDWINITMDPPHWYESRGIMQAISSIFNALEVLAFTATMVFAAKKFIAKHAVPNQTIIALATLTITLTGLDLIFNFLSKKEFWKDPAYLNEKGGETWKELFSQKPIPSYSVMLKAFPKAIRDRLTDEHHNELFRRDPALDLGCAYFVNKHGIESVKILDQANKDRLFMPIYECSAGLNYDTIVQRYGSVAIDAIICTDKERFLELLCSNIKGFSEMYLIPYKKLGLTQKECALCILTYEVYLLSTGGLTFEVFRSRNSSYLDHLKDFPSTDLIKDAFIKMLQTSKHGLVNLKKAFSSEFRVFELSNEELVKILWPHQKSKIVSYNDFKMKNGSDYLTTLLSQVPEAKPLFKQAFLKDAEQGISQITNRSDILLSLDLTYEQIAKEIGDNLVTQFQTDPSWEDFCIKHQPIIGFLLIDKPVLKQLLKDSFINEPSLFENGIYFCKILELTQAEIAKAVCDYTKKVIHPTFTRHFYNDILLDQTMVSAEDKAIIQKHFFDEFVLNLEGIDNLIDEMSLTYLGFTVTDVLKERWKEKDIATILQMGDKDHLLFVKHFNNPDLGLAAKVDNEIAGKDLKSILTNYETVLDNNPPNLQKAIARYYLQNLPLAYKPTEDATIHKMQRLQIAPKAEVIAKFKAATEAYLEASDVYEDSMQQAVKLQNQTTNQANADYEQAHKPHYEKLQLLVQKQNAIINQIAELNKDLEIQQKDLEIAQNSLTHTETTNKEIAALETEKHKLETDLLSGLDSMTSRMNYFNFDYLTKESNKLSKHMNAKIYEIQEKIDEKNEFIEKINSCKNDQDKIDASIQCLTEKIAKAHTELEQQTEVVNKATAEYQDLKAPLLENYRKTIDDAQQTVENAASTAADMFAKAEAAIKADLEAFLNTQLV